MAINPLARLSNFDVPTFPASAVRPDPSTWGNLASIGDAYASVKERQQLADLAHSATDAQGNLDINKFASAIALSGRDPSRMLTLLEAQQRAKEASAYHQEALDIAREGRDIQRQQANRPEYKVEEGGLLRPPGYWTMPRKPGEQPSFTPMPSRTGPVTPTPSPQSSIEPSPGAPAMAAAAPEQLPLPFDPENAPPYQVAGPPMPPPQSQPTAAAPAAAPAEKKAPVFNEDYLRTLPANAQTVIKGVANYEIDPDKYGKDKEDVVTAAKIYRPDYNTSEYQKRQTPPSGEIAARSGLGKAFLERTDAIRSRIQNDEINSLEGRALAFANQGAPGELRRAVDEGSEALLRGLTGAGMSQSEANNYARRYQLVAYDTKETQLRKVNELENALRHVITEVGKGRGGEDLTKDFRSKFGEPVVEKKGVASDAEVNALVARANQKLSEAKTPEERAIGLANVHRIMREKNVPPQFWPR